MKLVKMNALLYVLIFITFSCNNKRTDKINIELDKLNDAIEIIDYEKSYYLVAVPDTLIKDKEYHIKVFYNFIEISKNKYKFEENRFPFLYLFNRKSVNTISDTIVSVKPNRFDFIYSFNQAGKQKISGLIEEQIYKPINDSTVKISKLEMNFEKEFYIVD